MRGKFHSLMAFFTLCMQQRRAAKSVSHEQVCPSRDANDPTDGERCIRIPVSPLTGARPEVRPSADQAGAW